MIDAETALAALGTEDIASKLTDRGCFGRPLMPCDCPLARYLVQVNADMVRVGDRHVGFPCTGAFVMMPQAVVAFRSQFDHNKFQQLVAD